MLSELIYISDRCNIGNKVEISDILNACQKNNRGKITGVLLYNDVKFIQYLEGDYHIVNEMFQKIKQDPRHKNIRLVLFSPIEDRIFPSWNMGSKNLLDDDIIFQRIMSTKDEKTFNNLIKGSHPSKNTLSSIIKKYFD